MQDGQDEAETDSMPLTSSQATGIDNRPQQPDAEEASESQTNQGKGLDNSRHTERPLSKGFSRKALLKPLNTAIPSATQFIQVDGQSKAPTQTISKSSQQASCCPAMSEVPHHTQIPEEEGLA